MTLLWIFIWERLKKIFGVSRLHDVDFTSTDPRSQETLTLIVGLTEPGWIKIDAGNEEIPANRMTGIL